MELYSELYAYIQPYVTGALRSVIIQSVKLASRKFCRDTESWRSEHIQNSDENELTYAFSIDSYNAIFHRVVYVRVNDSEDVLDSSDYTVSTDRTSITLKNYPGASETNGIEIVVAMIPQYDAEALSDPFFDRWSEAIIAAAKYDMYRHADKPYTDFEQAEICNREYRVFVGDAKRESFRDGRTFNEQINLKTAREIWQ